LSVPLLVFVVVCLAWIVLLVVPFRGKPPAAGGEAHEGLIEEKRGLLFAIRDAELDFQGGKLSASDYEAIRARLEREASAIIARLDALEGGTPTDRVTAALDRLRRGEG